MIATPSISFGLFQQNGPHFVDDIFKCILLNDFVWISINISPKFVPESSTNNIPAMAWRRASEKPLHEPMITCFTEAYVRHSSPMS